jgi:hypothetical protein
MRKTSILFLLFFSLSTLNLLGQSSQNDDLVFLLKKIQTVYAGYKDKVNPAKFENLVKSIKMSSSLDTFMLFSKLTSYFKDHHLSLYQWIYPKDIDTLQCEKNYNYLSNVKIENNKEGYWIDESNSNIIFICRSLDSYLSGFVIESKKKIPRGYRLLKFSRPNGSKMLTDFMNISGRYRTFTESYFKNPNVLVVSSYSKWRKIDNYHFGMLSGKEETIYLPSFKQLDNDNVLVTMPNFNKGSSRIYDSLIKSNENIIANTKNVLIDIRGNGGGVINCFYSLLPYIYTNTIYTCEASVLASTDVIEDTKARRELYFNKKDTSSVKLYEDYLKLLNDKRDDFVYTPSDSLPCKQVKNNVKNVALIINHGCRSAAELMVLYFKQSTKVKVFGEPTAGAVDYLDMLTYSLPKTKYGLWVATAKRKLSSINPSYDRTGIIPDITIGDNTLDWVDFTRKYYEKN